CRSQDLPAPRCPRHARARAFRCGTAEGGGGEVDRMALRDYLSGMLAKRLAAFFDAAPAAALIIVTGAKGSTPREAGAWMLVSPEKTFGTIGGGQLEFLAIAKARELIAENIATGALDIPLGPEIGQCCGGRVALDIRIAEEGERADLLRRAESEDAARPHVYLFGGGHVGHALAAALALLPVRTVVVETRAEALEGMPDAVEGSE